MALMWAPFLVASDRVEDEVRRLLLQSRAGLLQYHDRPGTRAGALTPRATTQLTLHGTPCQDEEFTVYGRVTPKEYLPNPPKVAFTTTKGPE